MHTRMAIADVGIGVIAGYVGTKVMEPVSMKLYELESAEARRRADEVRPTLGHIASPTSCSTRAVG